MILIESKTARVFVNEKETTCVYYDKEKNTVFINYADDKPRKIRDVLGISYTNERYPTCLTYDTSGDGGKEQEHGAEATCK